MTSLKLQFGDIFFAELPQVGNCSIQQGIRPVIIVSNNSCNQFSPTITIIPLTSKMNKRNLPTHVSISGCGLTRESIALGEQILTIDKKMLKEKIGSISESLNAVNGIKKALMIQLNLNFGIAA